MNESMTFTHIFDHSNPNWQTDKVSNLVLLRGVQAHFNRLLQVKRVVFLNEILDYLSLGRIREGQRVGWVHDPAKEIDLGLYLTDVDAAHYVTLRFNVDGDVSNSLPEYKRVPVPA